MLNEVLTGQAIKKHFSAPQVEKYMQASRQRRPLFSLSLDENERLSREMEILTGH